MWKKALFFFLIVFIIGDIGYSFLQYYYTPFDGDVALCVVPHESVFPILENPLGFKAVIDQEAYLNPNRFFCHWSMYYYLNYVPTFLQSFTNPIESVYLASAIAKISVHILLLLLIAKLVVGKVRKFKWEWVIAIFLITPLFQTHGYRGSMGIIDPAITYTFFYALPVGLIILYFMPLLLENFHGIKWERRQWAKLLWLPLALVCSLSSPLNPGIALVFSAVLMLQHLLNNRDKSLLESIQLIPKSYLFYLIPISFFSLYSLYLGRYNTNTINEQLPLMELYARLPEGLYYQFAQKLGYPLLLILLLLNAILINTKWKDEAAKKILKCYKWIGCFAILYILLLPLGGYRTYRPYILRYDTMIPITLSLFFLYACTTIFILKRISIKQRKYYLPIIITALFIYTLADEAEWKSSDCEREALQLMAESPNKQIELEEPCTVISWDATIHPQSNELNMELLEIWRIIKE